MLIDPSYSPEAFAQRARDQGLTVTHVINTHGHPDHTNGNAKAAELTAAPVAAFADSLLVSPDLGLGDEQELDVGGLRLQFLHVPGHCPDHKHKSVYAHRASMFVAFGFSSLFLVSYIVNHALRGDTHVPGVGTARTVYLAILSSHILLSIIALPLVLTTLFFALSGRFMMHRRLARVTFRIWLYISVTGVVVFEFLKAY